ncbi:filamentous haemagglutinin family protein [Aquabacterium parvum]|uniref:filamentous haemagglutinin family protein n=1 Tax=Aquabacterium parvum TaxID=70584 RepID=UPI000718D079|nr:filamentous haemagglutinin family protein [Aquabacterium parvum]
MVVFFRAFVRRRSALREGRRAAFTRRLKAWAGIRRDRRWSLRPLAGAATCLLMGQAAWAAPDKFVLPVDLQGTRTIRGKTFSFQPAGQNSKLGPKVEFRDADGKLQSVSMKLVQTSKAGLYSWSSFDIGSSATFEIETPGAGSSSLHRVIGSTKLSEVYGTLKSNGSVYLINPNGVMFGQGAQVNVQGLVASTLNISDQDFLSLTDLDNRTTPVYVWEDLSGEDTPVTFDHPTNYVRVAPGATITTPSGGSVFLMARKVENAGTISTPGGQTALLAGDAVYLKSPDKEAKIYASEVNTSQPVLRGFLFEVRGNEGEASNLGTILTERGNTTLMANTVRQGGTIRATTSVQENGSVFLLARSGTISDDTTRASTTGTLVLTSGSGIEITPDNSVTAGGSVKMTQSRVELQGQTILMEGQVRNAQGQVVTQGASIQAPAANVNVRAETTPSYNAMAAEPTYVSGAAADGARFVMQEGARIDVSGTTDTTVSVARNFVQTELLRNGDLASNPFLKDGELLNKKVVYDVRSAPAVIEAATHQGYKDSIQTTAGERMAQGGQVNIVSTGAVLMQGGSQVDVSGGKVTFTEAVVAPTRLLGADGKAYTLNNARTDVQIVGVSGYQDADATRYGNVYQGQANPTKVEAGYTQGVSGGGLLVHAPTMVLDGQVRANVIQGERQRTGVDARASLATMKLGLGVLSNLVGGLTVRAPGAASPAVDWVNPLTATLPDRSSVSVDWFNASGAGDITVSTQGGLKIEDGANIALQRGGSLTLSAAGEDGIYLGGDISGAGASVSVTTKSVFGSPPFAGGITLAAGRRIDVAGDVVNQRRDGGQAGTAVAGGKVTISSAAGLDLQAGTAIDVSGGATVSTTGGITGTRAGSISLAANSEAKDQGFKAVELGASLQGHTLAGTTTKAFNDVGDASTGKLTLKVGEVDIVGPDAPALKKGSAIDGFVLGSGFFNQGGFSQFDIDGVRRLTVDGSARIKPQVAQWLAKARLLNAATGSKLSANVSTGVQADNLAPKRSLSLGASGVEGVKSDQNGRLRIQSGAEIDMGLRGSVTLLGGVGLEVDGAVRAAGGSITTGLVTPFNGGEPDERLGGTYRFGAGALLDVSGVTVLSANNVGSQRFGSVIDGGVINVMTPVALQTTTPLVFERQVDKDGKVVKQATLLANGAQDAIDVRAQNSLGQVRVQRTTVASNGGSIAINVGAQGAALAGSYQAKAGGAGAQGGALSVSITDGGSTKNPIAALEVQQALAPQIVQAGKVVVSADMVQAGGFAHLKLKSNDEIATVGKVNLSVQGDMTLDSPVLAARGNSQAVLAAAGRLARTNTDQALGAQRVATGGQGGVTLRGAVVDLSGLQVTQGIDQLTLQARDEIRFHAISQSRNTGSLNTGATQVTLDADQVNVATATDFSVQLSGVATDGNRLTITGGNRAAPLPLSAGGSLTLAADHITVDGVVRAPFGQITLKSKDITLTENADLSVSGAGLSVPYGTTTEAGTNWQLNGVAITAPPAKTVTFDAEGGELSVESGAKVDLSAGGNLLAWEFVPGPGGSSDIFHGTYESGTFAVVPSVKGLGGVDAGVLAGSGLDSSVLDTSATRTITFGEGGPIPAGTYTVLPARYALLAGGYLVRRTSTTTPLNFGDALTLATGAVRVGATVGSTGGALSSTPATFEVINREQALRFSEIKTTTFDDLVNAKAARQGVAPARRAVDAGTLNIAAQKINLEGDLAFDRLAGGRGGELNISSDKVQVGGVLTPAQVAAQDTLLLNVAQLNRTGVDSLLIGGLRSSQAADGSRLIDVKAKEVTLANDASNPLALNDVILAGTSKVTVNAGAALSAPETNQASFVAEDSTAQGNGALVRVSSDAQVQTRRVSTEGALIDRSAGDVSVGAGAVLKGGTVVVEGTRSTALDKASSLQADSLTLGADRVVLGDADVATTPGQAAPLQVGSALLAQLAQVDRLTLRAFRGVELQSGQNLTVQQSLTLDTPELKQASGSTNSVTAGSLSLRNTSGAKGSAQGGTATLNLTATGAGGQDGHIHFDDGIVATQGAGQVNLAAAGSVVLSSRRETTTVTLAADPGNYADATSEVVNNVTQTTVKETSRAIASGLQADAAVNLSAQSVTTGHGAVAQIKSGQGALTIEQATAAGPVSKASVGTGGQIELAGASLRQQGLLEVTSGAIKLEASTGDVTFSSGSRTLADGASWQVDGVTVPIAAGLIQAKAAQGGIDVQAGSLLSASAPSGLAGGEAGDIRLLAPKGEVKVAGDIRLLSDANQRGGALRIDARTAPSLDGLVDRLNASAQAAATQAGAAAARANASRAFDLQQRDGQDITLSAGKKLVAQDVRLVADRAADASSGGNVNILGQIDASGGTGGRISISAAGDLDIGQDSIPDGQTRASLDVSAKGAAKSGGDITLASRSGALRLNEQADVRASGGTTGADGSLTLRAGVREDGAVDGDQGVGNSRVAAIQSTLTGVGTLTVQGEERTTVDDLSAQVLTDAKARSEAFQQSAAALDTLNKVANGKLGASAVAKVQSAQVLQSEGDLTLSTDWNLTELVKESSGSQFVVKPSAHTPMSLSIVSAGNLNIQASLSGGFVNVPLPGTAQASAAANTTLSNAMKVGAADLPLMAGSDITLVAGAELGSADVAATAAGTAADVRIGDPADEPTSAKQVFVRSTTGDLHLVASRDVVLENDRATVYTTGLLASAEQVPGAEGFGRGNASSPKLHASLITRGNGVNTTRQLPFMLGGGSVSLQAGRDLRTQSVGNASFVSDWTFHKSDVNADKSQSWWARYDLFDMGVATFGGGDIIARAGGDVVDMGFVTATSGYKDDAGVVRRFGGGDVEVSADGNIAGLLAKVGGSTGRVDAGLNIEGTSSQGAVSLFYENTQLQVQAGQDILVDLITEAGLHGRDTSNGSANDSATNSVGIAGLGSDASLNLTSASGSIALNAVKPPRVDSTRKAVSALPSQSRLAAPHGDILAAYLNQMPQSGGATLDVLAGGDLKASGVTVWANSPFGEGVQWARSDVLSTFTIQDSPGGGDALTAGSFENARREPVRLIAQTGDVTLRAEVGDATRIIAGKDVNLLGLLVQQQDGNELSLVQAGRDLNVIGTTRVRGPGDALFVAGRDVNLTAADGIDTNGNRENGALPEGSANLTVMAGVQPGTSDFGVAEQRFFHLLGGAGVADRPADLYAQLLAARGGQAVPGLDSAAAQAFAGQGFAEQLAAARDLVGAQAFEAAVLTYMQGRDAKPDLSTAQALAALANVPQREQAALLGSVLAPAWSQAVAPEVQRGTALDMAKARGGAYALALSEYLKLRTGTTDLGDAQALQAFEQLSAEQRLLFTNQVLKRELTVAGINATQEKTPDAKLDAYQSGFNALATVFPGSQDTSSLLMGASSIKTQQNSQINVFTPHGGMNVGRLTGLADSAAAAKLGIVTTSGGDITGVVRDSVEVNQSRIFVVENGDMLLWASFGNIDAGKGSKTVTGAPAPVVRVVDGRLVVDTTGSFSGSGIAALDPDSKLYLFAPRGEINAGEAGIRAGGSITLDAPTIVGANDIQIAGGGNLAPPPTVGNAATNVGSLGQSATAAGPSQAESRGTSTPKRRLLLDFLGFGSDKDEDSERDDKKK